MIDERHLVKQYAKDPIGGTCGQTRQLEHVNGADRLHGARREDTCDRLW